VLIKAKFHFLRLVADVLYNDKYHNKLHNKSISAVASKGTPATQNASQKSLGGQK